MSESGVLFVWGDIRSSECVVFHMLLLVKDCVVGDGRDIQLATQCIT